MKNQSLWWWFFEYMKKTKITNWHDICKAVYLGVFSGVIIFSLQ